MNYRRIVQITILTLIVVTMAVSPALAAKPDGSNGTKDVIAKSNGFPSGMHFNLNIHGHEYLVDTCTHEAGGHSVFIHQYGDSIIEYRADKRAGTELTAIDPCVCNNGGDNKVTIQLPKAVMVTEEGALEPTRKDVDGYYVYARILGKPQNGKNDPDDRSNILFSPNMVTYTADLVEQEEELLEMGLITWNATYYAGDEAFYRFEDPDKPAKGRSKARPITHLFEYTGWVVSDELDTYEPELDEITVMDIPVRDWDENFSTPEDRNADGDLDLDDDDIVAWLIWVNDESLARSFIEEWIFNIADIVYTEGEVTNDGTKLLQVRFYPYFEE